MKSPNELNLGNTIMPAIMEAQHNGVDIKNVLESILKKMPETEKVEPINPRDHINKKILFTTSFDYYVREGIIQDVSLKGFVLIKATHNPNEQWYDPASLYIQEIFE